MGNENLQANHEKYTFSSRKKLNYQNAPVKIELLKSEGKTVTYIDGVFDLLHVGHLEYLELARQTADLLMVGIKPDSMVKRIKGD